MCKSARGLLGLKGPILFPQYKKGNWKACSSHNLHCSHHCLIIFEHQPVYSFGNNLYQAPSWPCQCHLLDSKLKTWSAWTRMLGFYPQSSTLYGVAEPPAFANLNHKLKQSPNPRKAPNAALSATSQTHTWRASIWGLLYHFLPWASCLPCRWIPSFPITNHLV